MPVTISPIFEDQFDTMLQAFNEGYEDYIVPFHLEAPQLQGHITNGSINLSASRLAFDEDGRVIGIVLMGIRGQRGWVGGVGVNKAWRGKGIGRQLMQALIASARERGLSELQLEVIQGNTAAYNLYQNLGFEDIRRLLILSRQPASLNTDSTIAVESIDPADALAQLEAFHIQPNPWQREPDSLRPQLARMVAWAVKHNNGLVALAVGFAGEKNIQWSDLGFAPDHTDSLRALVLSVHIQYPEAVGRIVNLPEDDPAWPVLSSLDYAETLAQHEMKLSL